MRLGDLDALKEIILKEYKGYEVSSTSASDIIKIIDNAPTVEPDKIYLAKIHFDEEQLQEIVDKAKSEVLESTERQQDKWGKWVISEIQCPNCLEYFQTDCYSTEDLNICPCCGAKMRGDVK